MARSVRAPRILIIVENLPVPLDRRVWLQCRALVAAGYGVAVICPKGDGDPSYELLEGVHLYKYRIPALAAATGAGAFLLEFAYSWIATAILTVKVLFGPGFDVLQACNPPDTYFTIAAFYKLLGKRFVFDQHDLSPEIYSLRFARPSRLVYRILVLLELWTHRLADQVITVNGSVRDLLVTRTGSPPEKVRVVRTGPDLERLHRVTPRPELRRGSRHLCCYLGVMGPQDRVDLLLRAADVLVNDLGRRDCHFLLIGFGECLDDLKRLAVELGLEEAVTFTGRASDEQICAYLSSADVALSPDPKNPFNDVCTMIKTLEYMTFGLPIVSFDLKETRRSADEAAIYVQGDDPRAFAVALTGLLDDPERRARMGRAGRRRIEEGLSWDHQKHEYLDMYQQLISHTSNLAPHDQSRTRMPIR
jgi:glycosyltransferase involved in cell wall biosynthesis